MQISTITFLKLCELHKIKLHRIFTLFLACEDVGNKNLEAAEDCTINLSSSLSKFTAFINQKLMHLYHCSREVLYNVFPMYACRTLKVR